MFWGMQWCVLAWQHVPKQPSHVDKDFRSGCVPHPSDVSWQRPFQQGNATSWCAIFFPNSVSLGSSAIVKVPEQVGAAKIPLFPGRGSQARFPGRGSQTRFPSKVLRKRFPGFPKVRKNRFRSKVPKSRFPSQVPKQGSQEQVITRSRFAKIPNGSQEQVPKQGSQEQVPKQGYHARFPRIGVQEQVPRNRFPGTSRDRFPSEFTKKEFRSKSQEQICKQGVQCPRKVLVVPDRWSIKGLSRFISSSFQTSFRQTSVDFFT